MSLTQRLFLITPFGCSLALSALALRHASWRGLFVVSGKLSVQWSHLRHAIQPNHEWGLLPNWSWIHFAIYFEFLSFWSFRFSAGMLVRLVLTLVAWAVGWVYVLLASLSLLVLSLLTDPCGDAPDVGPWFCQAITPKRPHCQCWPIN